MHVQFQNTRGLSISRGPFDGIVFEGETVRARRGGPVIATHMPHCWTVDGGDFLRLDIEPAVAVTWDGFAGAPSTTGHFSSVNGIAYIDRRIFAVVDRQQGDWYLLREGVHQALFCIQAAGSMQTVF